MSKILPSQSPLSQTPQLFSVKEELSSITQILHLTHHRNKNQHRLTKWWKQFSILRRNISKLLLEVENLETAEKFSTGGDKGGKAFSTVVKDLQYANLGLVLLGMLARIRTVIRSLGKEKLDKEEEIESETQAGGNERVDELSRVDEAMQDLGEVVRREDVATLDHEEEQDEEDKVAAGLKASKAKGRKSGALPALKSDSEPRPKKSKEEKKKKKRKRGDAFDDLFDRLI
ncbi:hypothetical protein EG329_006900 [Mollisiaceae sp. DMI_Dod_QoI]|nr:hypothetical protein EG329_006900 [Helotiales sp. DMI_Dod_QoI]